MGTEAPARQDSNLRPSASKARRRLYQDGYIEGSTQRRVRVFVANCGHFTRNPPQI